jgi:hypothetical protein
VSKLFQQLKEAARRRESAAPSPEKTTLLQQAMQRAATDAARAGHAAPPDPDTTPAVASASAGRALPWGSFAAIAAVALGLGWQLGAMRSAVPPVDALAPRAAASWPGMKIEKTLDLTRTGGAARSSPPGPAPSR